MPARGGDFFDQPFESFTAGADLRSRRGYVPPRYCPPSKSIDPLTQGAGLQGGRMPKTPLFESLLAPFRRPLNAGDCCKCH
jgi:hypothetical protein